MSLTTAQDVAISSSEAQQGISALAEQGVTALAAPELAPAVAAEPARAQPWTHGIPRAAAIRVFDVVVAAVLLVVLLPLILLLVIAVRVESAGPALFRCERVGYRGRQLRMLKLRKMRCDAQGCSLTTDGDARFTRIGGLLSKLKIDEIPQLWHVLRGEMSLVGPRPECAEFVGLHPQDYAEILAVPPGMTGLSQIAFVDECRILDPDNPIGDYVSRILPQKVALDRMYASRRTLSFNLRILFWTPVALLLRCPVTVNHESGKMTLRRR
jgi:lipopolysaccharide/colanic/teichoic acid biosynthesis glycosyltransferase